MLSRAALARLLVLPRITHLFMESRSQQRLMFSARHCCFQFHTHLAEFLCISPASGGFKTRRLSRSCRYALLFYILLQSSPLFWCFYYSTLNSSRISGQRTSR